MSHFPNHKFNVLDLPIVSPAQATYVAIIGGSVKLICTITSSDHAITGVFWRKGSAFGSPTLSTGTKYVIANTGTTLQKFTSLIINSVMSTDEADYFCSAQNQDGTSISSITLHIPARKTMFYIILLLHVNEDGIQNNIPLNSY